MWKLPSVKSSAHGKVRKSCKAHAMLESLLTGDVTLHLHKDFVTLGAAKVRSNKSD